MKRLITVILLLCSVALYGKNPKNLQKAVFDPVDVIIAAAFIWELVEQDLGWII